jgi:hypothetical protein
MIRKRQLVTLTVLVGVFITLSPMSLAQTIEEEPQFVVSCDDPNCNTFDPVEAFASFDLIGDEIGGVDKRLKRCKPCAVHCGGGCTDVGSGGTIAPCTMVAGWCRKPKGGTTAIEETLFSFPEVTALSEGKSLSLHYNFPPHGAHFIGLENIAVLKTSGFSTETGEFSDAHVRIPVSSIDTSASVSIGIDPRPIDPISIDPLVQHWLTLNENQERTFSIMVNFDRLEFTTTDRSVLDSYLVSLEVNVAGNTLVFDDDPFKEYSIPRLFREYLSSILWYEMGAEDLKAPFEDSRSALLAKLCDVECMLLDHNVEGAVAKLRHDIQAKADGFSGGNRRNDWVTSESAAKLFYSACQKIIDSLETLLER